MSVNQGGFDIVAIDEFLGRTGAFMNQSIDSFFILFIIDK